MSRLGLGKEWSRMRIRRFCGSPETVNASSRELVGSLMAGERPPPVVCASWERKRVGAPTSELLQLSGVVPVA
jgi:hypothetical protein